MNIKTIICKSRGHSGYAAAILALTLLVAGQVFAKSPGPVYDLKVDQAALLRKQKIEPVKPIKDAFGPGRDAALAPFVYDGRIVPSQLRWTCRDIPEGDYYVELPVASPDYLGFSEKIAGRECNAPGIRLYHNDTPLAWQGHTFPSKPDGAAVKDYVASMIARDPIRIKKGDLLRVVSRENTVIGAIRLHTACPDVDIELPQSSKLLHVENNDGGWLALGWEPTRREGRTVVQPCWLFNPGAAPLTVHLKAEARDFLQTPLLDNAETVVIPPLGRLVKTYTFETGGGGRTRLALMASADGCEPTHYRSKFFVEDITAGPRSRTSLNGAWEVCYVPGVEPGDAPPAKAEWKPCVVPILQDNKPGHCMWLRRAFASPAYVAGERIVINFGQALSESWLYVNGKMVHHQFDGAEPFEADVTAAWKIGATNEILVAVRDWIAYSPKNRERITSGEQPIHKNNMIAPSGYYANGYAGGCMGLGRPVYLETRPAVAVADVSIATTLRDRKLRLAYRLANKSSTRASVVLTPAILDAGREMARLPAQTVIVEPGATSEAKFEVPWPKDVQLWQPGAPYLYVLQTDLAGAAGTADRHIQRFGFRDIWIEGIHFIVNGKRMKIRSNWAGSCAGQGEGNAQRDIEKRLEGIWDRQMLAMHTWNAQLARTHNGVGVRESLEIADETGLMIKPENGSFCQQGFTFDQEYWKNAIAGEISMVEIYRNHPSVFMWSAGNENMWGWAYQGEAARTLGNRWQVKMAQAMRQVDPQARPIEWEADGDLMGKWEHHALHYPRELSGSPAVPVSAWWGALDGKTVIPYSMGPITLGEKPLTVGEAFWPNMMNNPFGGTILLGDKDLQGAWFQWKAWLESSQYLVNGFRDVEFALIDTYSPMGAPQAIVLKEETAVFYGGQTLSRHLNVHNDVSRDAKLTLQWSLRSASGKTIAKGREKLTLGPAELRRLALPVRLPVVRQDMPATFEVQLIEGGQVVHSLSRPWLICAHPAINVPPDLKLSLFDPQGATAAMLTSMGIPFTPLATIKAPQAGALMLGKDALKLAAPGPWREQLLAFVRGGGKLAILEQSESPDFLPFPVNFAPKKNSTIVFVRAADHPLMKGIDDARLRWWTGSSEPGLTNDHYVSRGNYRKPVDGNCLPIVDAGTMDGLLESPLMEQYLGKGCILLCQMLLTDKAAAAPVPAQLLQNLLDYLAAPAVYRQGGKTALLAGANDKLRAALTKSRLVFDDLTTDRLAELKAAQYKLAIVDVESALNETTAKAIKAFADEGGTVLLHRAKPDKKPLLESLLGVGLVFTDVAKETSGDVHYRVFRRGQGGLRDGISNHELLWLSAKARAELQGEGRWWSVLKVPPEELVAEYFCNVASADAARAAELTHPCALLAAPSGKGMIVLNQLRIDEPLEETAQTVSRLRSLLLTNLGGVIQAQGTGILPRDQRLAKYEFFPVSLAAYANRGLKDDKAAGIVGWSNQGENDMRAMPTGAQKFAGVSFYIPAPKSVIVLHSPGEFNGALPKEVKNIVVNRRADTLFFLHALAYGSGTKPFMYRVNYQDGTSVAVPISLGCQVFDWWDDPSRNAENMSANGTVIGFSGDNPMRKGVSVLLYEWANPHPDKQIAGVDFSRVGEDYAGVPVLAGITAATMQSDEGVVTDIVGMHGMKVRLGTQIVEVHYIGVAALDEKNPFYAQALAAHKAMVVGKRVRLEYDVVRQNNAGQTMAYVILSAENDNSVNSRIIGGSLGAVGNFEGNSTQRTYLENLEFIAKQSKKGIWSVP